MASELVKKIALGLVPKSYQLPLRYCYEWSLGRLEPEMFVLEKLVGSKQRVIDIGANYGLYSYYLAKKGKFVEAFEPLPECARSIAAYQSSRIRLHNVALSSTSGEMQLFTPIINGVPYPASSSFAPANGPHEICEVAVKTLDDYAFENVCLVKIDVEGHELEVLKGGVQTLLRERPVILVEIEQRHHNLPISEVFAYLMAQDFAGFFLGSGKLVPLSEFSFETHQKPYLKDVNNRAYVNNFLFLPMESVSPALLRNCVR